MTSPLFISFEGPDGSGKSTQARLLAATLRARGAAVLETREPGGTAVGEQVRHILLAPSGAPMTPLVMALLLSASRAQLMDEVVAPALGTGKTVITDRFADSTIAYQGYGMGLDVSLVRALTGIATRNRHPDITIYVDIEPEVGLQRVSSRGETNRLDNASLAFHRRVRDGYLALINADTDRWIRVDGGGSEDEVHRAVMAAFDSRICSEGDAS